MPPRSQGSRWGGPDAAPTTSPAAHSGPGATYAPAGPKSRDVASERSDASGHRFPRMGSCIGEADRHTWKPSGGQAGSAALIPSPRAKVPPGFPVERMRMGCGRSRARPGGGGSVRRRSVRQRVALVPAADQPLERLGT
jgi:hypothetical protein